jgi:hypothetical protein
MQPGSSTKLEGPGCVASTTEALQQHRRRSLGSPLVLLVAVVPGEVSVVDANEKHVVAAA